MDWSMIRDSISPAANQMQLRQAAVISVEAGGTCTVSLAGTTVPGVVYWQPPCPGAACWVLWQGGGPMVVGASTAVPMFSGIANPATALANATWTAIPNGGGWATADDDPWGMVSAAGTFTAPCDGMWQLNASAAFAANATGLRGLRLLQGGTTTLAWAQVAPINGTQTALSCATIRRLSKGNTVEAEMHQTSGAALNTGHMAFSAAWVSG